MLENAAGTWFVNESFLRKHNIKRPCDSIFPDYIFSDGLTIDSLRLVQYAINNYDNPLISPYTINLLNHDANRIIDKFDNALRKNHPWRYYVYSRFSSMKSSFFQLNSSYRSVKYPINVVLIFVNALVSFLTLTLGGVFSIIYIGVFLFGKAKRNIEIVFLICFPLLMSLIMNFGFQDHEGRAILLLYYIISIISFIGLNDLFNGQMIGKKFGKFVVLASILIGCIISYYYTQSTIIW